MQSQLSRLNRHLMSRNVLLAGLLVSILCALAFQHLKTRLGTVMLDEIEGYGRETLVEQLLLYGAAGRALHMQVTLYVDMVFPLAYGALFGGLLALAGRQTRWRLASLFIVPVMLLDWAENIQLLWLLSGFPDFSDAHIALASATTIAKFWAIRLALLVLGLLAFTKLAKRLRSA
jgi:hypothetical protein